MVAGKPPEPEPSYRKLEPSKAATGVLLKRMKVPFGLTQGRLRVDMSRYGDLLISDGGFRD